LHGAAGPEAQQLATYIGWLLHRTWGGVVAGALFVLPSLVLLIALSWLYLAFGNVPAVAGFSTASSPPSSPSSCTPRGGSARARSSVLCCG
jgi:chromate transport protein ChrA